MKRLVAKEAASLCQIGLYAFFQPVPQSVDKMVAKVKTNFELLMALFVCWLVLFACMIT